MWSRPRRGPARARARPCLRRRAPRGRRAALADDQVPAGSRIGSGCGSVTVRTGRVVAASSPAKISTLVPSWSLLRARRPLGQSCLQRKVALTRSDARAPAREARTPRARIARGAGPARTLNITGVGCGTGISSPHSVSSATVAPGGSDSSWMVTSGDARKRSIRTSPPRGTWTTSSDP